MEPLSWLPTFALSVALWSLHSPAVSSQCDYGLNSKAQSVLKLPPEFLFGSGSSAAQTEGAWNEDGKGESDWDLFWHDKRRFVADNATPDVSCNSYHRWEDDINVQKVVGFSAYRFSLSWPRLLPTGQPNNVNQKAVDHYQALIDAVLENNMTPVVTLYHFDLPLNISRMGGWANRNIVDDFQEYAVWAFKTFGDKVKTWITINEPLPVCSVGYGSPAGPPGMNISGIADYQCVHNVILAHSAAYRAYHSMKESQDGGKVGITIGSDYYYPKNNMSWADRLAAEIAMDFTFGWPVNAILGNTGDYPPSMRTRVDANSRKEGRMKSRLPRFTPEEVLLVRGAADFIGINHYTSYLASFSPPGNQGGTDPNFDSGVYSSINNDWNKTIAGQFINVPWGFGDMLRYVRDRYNNPYVLVTENGLGVYGDENIECNPDREQYFKGYIRSMLEAIQEGCNVHGYFVWSLLDSFEWYDGYTIKYGVAHVDFDSVNRTRTVKGIAKFFQNVMKYGLPSED